MNEVADAHEQTSGLARDRRPDRRVLEIEFSVFYCRAVCPHHSRGCRGRRLELIPFLSRDISVGDELRVAGDLFLCIRRASAVTRQCRDGLFVRVPIRPRIDLKERLPLPHLLAFLKQHVRDDPIDLRRDRCSLYRRHDAVRIQSVRNWRASRRGDRDSDGGSLRTILRFGAGGDR